MASSVFLDTNGWLALLNSADAMHKLADTVWSSLIRSKAQIVFTDWIVAETGNGLARFRPKDCLKESFERLLRSPRTELVDINGELLLHGLDFYTRHGDKSWGLVDCASFLVMRERGITEAFTSDRHFEQAGFTCLLN